MGDQELLLVVISEIEADITRCRELVVDQSSMTTRIHLFTVIIWFIMMKSLPFMEMSAVVESDRHTVIDCHDQWSPQV